ncbi:MAG: hypothetical protein M0Q95_02830 [Porticoccaceae bacterium]|nr:hypothetical protein [Porticoccaceae bacterium]
MQPGFQALCRSNNKIHSRGLSLRWAALAFLLMAAFGARAEGEVKEGEVKDDIPAGAFYRYYNAEGNQVMDFSIPPEYTDKGYEILSPSGRLLKKVPARTDADALTAEDIAAQEAQKKEDAYILRSYSSLDDVDRARKRRLALVEREINILKGNIVEYRRRETELKERAAAYQASGQQAPDNITAILSELDGQQVSARKQLAERRRQYRDVAIRFEHQRQRLQELRPELKTGDSPKASQKSGEKAQRQ